MSSSATPISPARFAAALSSLPLSNLHLKAAELRNSIAHLEHSNLQLQPLAEANDQDCKEAVKENRETIARMEDRIALLKAEVIARGFRWGEHEVGKANGQGNSNGSDRGNLTEGGDGGHLEAAPASSGNHPRNNQSNGAVGGRFSDEQMATRLQDRIAEDVLKGEDDGLHL